jgi:hypothetical protein
MVPLPGCRLRTAGSNPLRRLHLRLPALLQLAYASAREDAGGRATRRADRLRAQLGWEPGILNGEGGKPKWMRWRTFDRLTAKHDALVKRSVQAVALKLGGFRDFLE